MSTAQTALSMLWCRVTRNPKQAAIAVGAGCVFLLFLAYCSSTSGGAQRGPTVKGVRLGMPLVYAAEALMDRVDAESWSYVIEEGRNGQVCFISTPEQLKKTGRDMASLMFFDTSMLVGNADGHVQSILLRGRFASALFGAKDMDLESFARQFMDAYGIPQLKPVTQRARNLNGDFVTETVYTYQSPDGWRVELSGAEMLLSREWTPNVMMESVASAEERRFD